MALAIVLSTGSSGGIVLATAPVASASASVTGTGSSFAYPAFSTWETSEGIINEADTNSIVGLNSFAQGTVEYGASDISYDTNQAQYTPRPPEAPFQYLPDVSGGLAFFFTLQGSDGQPITNLRISPGTLVGIFTDHITKWNDPAIIRDNVGNGTVAQNLPDTPIIPVVRGDPCGETYLLEYYFQTVEPQAWDAYLAQVTPGGHPSTDIGALYDYPSNTGVPAPPGMPFTGWLNPNSATDAASAVQGDNGAIGYSVTAWPILDHIPYAYLQNPAGHWVQPNVLSIATALSRAILYSDLTENLTNTFTNRLPDSYPVSSYSYVITQEQQMNPGIGAQLSKFVYYMACEGQAQIVNLEYSPIPVNLVIDDFQAAERMGGHSPPPALNGSGCPNPYLTGQLAGVPEPKIEGGPPVAPSATTVPANTGAGGGGSSTDSGAQNGSGGSQAATVGVNSAASAGKRRTAGAREVQVTTTTIPIAQIIASLPGAALTAASKGLKPSGPSALTAALWTVGLVVLVGTPPLALLTWRVRHRRARRAGAP